MNQPRKILVFRIGSLGDTLIAIPAIKVLKAQWPNAEFHLLGNASPDGRVMGADIFDGSNFFETYLRYPLLETLPVWKRPLALATLAISIRRMKIDTLAYLAPSVRKGEQIARDLKFFRMAGIQRFLAMEGFGDQQSMGKSLGRLPREAEMILERLKFDGIETVKFNLGDKLHSLNLTEQDFSKVQAWKERLPSESGKSWVGIAPGSNQAATVWPTERYVWVVRELIREFDLWPVVFGGAKDKTVADEMLKEWGRGYNACGALGVRAAAAALEKCRFYLGNDTGTMHLAAAAGIHCVGVFSAHNPVGKWDPLGVGHRILRAEIDCECCGLTVCHERNNECLRMVKEMEVLEACREIYLKGGR
jgi:ADP-heptose:LPS heptosyltransferase